MATVSFPTRIYFEVDYDAFDALIQQHLGMPGFEAQRVYEWPNDSYAVASTLDEDIAALADEEVAEADDSDKDSDLRHFLRFLTDTRAGAITEEKQAWRDLMESRKDVVEHEPEPYVVLDRQLASYRHQGRDLPPFDAFLRELAVRDIIPEGWYLISICW